MKIINTVTEKSFEVNGVDTLRGIVNVTTKNNPYVKGIENNVIIELSSSTKEYINILIADELLSKPEYSDFVKEENYQPNFQKFPWGDELEHDFLYRVYLSNSDITKLTKEYFHIIQAIKTSPENPSVTINGGELIYIDNILPTQIVDGVELPDAYTVITEVLSKEFEANPRML